MSLAAKAQRKSVLLLVIYKASSTAKACPLKSKRKSSELLVVIERPYNNKPAGPAPLLTINPERNCFTNRLVFVPLVRIVSSALLGFLLSPL